MADKDDKNSAKGQHRKFVEAARTLGCDKSEDRFDAALKKVAAHKPPKDNETGAPQSEAEPSKETR